MAIDYSKWDKIELSDDSDIEVHPNVDKKSFIKWKQRDIHEKRAQRDQDIRTLTVQTAMYKHLNLRVDYLLGLPDAEFTSEAARDTALRAKYDPAEKFVSEDSQDTPTYNEMIEDLFTQIGEDMTKDGEQLNAETLRRRVVAHRERIGGVMEEQEKKLAQLIEEKSYHISSADMHTGFEKSFLNKSEGVAEPSKELPTKVTLNPKEAKERERPVTVPTPSAPIPSAPTPRAPTQTSAPADSQDLDELELLPETERFSYISSKDLVTSAKYLDLHPFIVTEQQKDALIMTAFNAQLEGNAARARDIVHQSLLLQYGAQLAGMTAANANKKERVVQTQKAVKMFFGKLMSVGPNPAIQGFREDVERTYNHIRERCLVIQQEQPRDNEEGDAIQLKSLDPSTELVVSLPNAESVDPEEVQRYNAFLRLPIKMQEAVRTGSLDAINEVFLHMSTDDAEDILEIFDESGVIGINAVLENEEEFLELQEQYHRENDGQPVIEELGDLEIEDHISTADIVD
ncbi:hypothetical protein BABINDRAFT_8956 [Babjeviella inositovora NRRL Y-12698]|uniref:Hsp90 chaperone protein kinase-targeting subunit n=1 Tax=Babjeviella inositovora NRRL Y-12698 TaxID=984486 RepID=A0A1E3QNQ0_9ASCO|nr:uncharacterized protein BABINDRAFT_8956 [Babjeviella inositovora NRRL Y-12698]ODQ78712.1 hypothetical protein BABINDRAFT_8956 [Babjeviella inositovora NRRL Y-12698]